MHTSSLLFATTLNSRLFSVYLATHPHEFSHSQNYVAKFSMALAKILIELEI